MKLAVLLSHTAEPGLSQEKVRNRASAQWELLMQRGRALRCLEAAARGMIPPRRCSGSVFALMSFGRVSCFGRERQDSAWCSINAPAQLTNGQRF